MALRGLTWLSVAFRGLPWPCRYEKAGGEDEDDTMFQWWWEATVPDVEKAAEEAEGAEMDMCASRDGPDTGCWLVAADCAR